MLRYAKCIYKNVFSLFSFVNYAVSKCALAGAPYIAIGNPRLIPLLGALIAGDIRVVLSAYMYIALKI